MAWFTTRDGCRLAYELAGKGPLVVLTPGGRESRRVVAPLAEALAERVRVLSWDRRNTGESEVSFGRESEQVTWADDLAELLEHLGEGPAWLAGGSAGCRVSTLAAIRRPDLAKGLIVWSASGGNYSCQFLGYLYHVPYILAAQGGGMAAVAETPFFHERIVDNPANRARLLACDPDEFVAVMKGWNHAFYPRPDQALVSVDDAALQRLALPTRIFAGNDDIHPQEVSEAMARLIPGAELAPSPWSTEAFMAIFTGRTPGSVFDLYPRLAPGILEFIAAHEGVTATAAAQ